MLKFDARRAGNGSSARAAYRMPDAPGAKTPGAKALSVAALDLSSEPAVPAYSPIVLAGTVRLIELAITVLIGSAIYAAYVVPVEGFEWHYVAGILTIAVMSTLALQAADVYQVQAFRGHEKQYMRLASAWSVVFLVAISMSFFAKAGDEFSRVWLGSFYVGGLAALIASRSEQCSTPQCPSSTSSPVLTVKSGPVCAGLSKKRLSGKTAPPPP